MTIFWGKNIMRDGTLKGGYVVNHTLGTHNTLLVLCCEVYIEMEIIYIYLRQMFPFI